MTREAAERLSFQTPTFIGIGFVLLAIKEILTYNINNYIIKNIKRVKTGVCNPPILLFSFITLSFSKKRKYRKALH
ncbi:hypothetical protein STEG23_023426 [Scotinomys teguina]